MSGKLNGLGYYKNKNVIYDGNYKDGIKSGKGKMVM